MGAIVTSPGRSSNCSLHYFMSRKLCSRLVCLNLGFYFVGLRYFISIIAFFIDSISFSVVTYLKTCGKHL